MRRKLAIAAARWLSKRENRDKLIRSARKLKERIEHEEGVRETPARNTGRRGEPERPHDRHDDGRPRSDTDT